VKTLQGPGDSIGAGDTHLHLNLLPHELAQNVFARVKDEVSWNVMHHRGELRSLFVYISTVDHASV
jgi:hypothetical protein